MSITITWHGHSCFSVSADGYSIVLDPYAPNSVPGLPPLSLSASQVLCSHGHSDHGYTDAVDLSARKPGLSLYCHGDPDLPRRSKRITPRGKPDPYPGGRRSPDRPSGRPGVYSGARPGGAFKGSGRHYDPRRRILYHRCGPGQNPGGGGKAQDRDPHALPLQRPSAMMSSGRLEDYTKLCRDVVTYASASMVLEKDTPAQTAVLSL